MPLTLDDFQYPLPPELIASHPVTPRDHCRLLLVNRQTGHIAHHHFYELPGLLAPDDLLILNNTKVLPTRLHADSGRIEILLLEETSPRHWIAIGKPSSKMKPGMRLMLTPPHPDLPGVELEILKTLPDGSRVLRFFEDFNLTDYGQLPLPPYIQKARAARLEPVYGAEDSDAYQTVYAEQAGSVAAPTAGLHFTPELLAQFQHAFVTLHVGLGTFRPVKVQDLAQHDMHTESYSIPAGLAAAAEQAGRLVAVGTTSCRVLESAPKLQPCTGSTRIFIHPPYTFKRTGALLTNFHLPGSTLLMLVSAFMGLELQREAYRQAIAERYRFFSYGDAMLIL